MIGTKSVIVCAYTGSIMAAAASQVTHDPVVIALAVSVGPSFIALLAYLQGRKSHVLINSRMTELLKLNRANERAKGLAEGRRQEKKKRPQGRKGRRTP